MAASEGNEATVVEEERVLNEEYKIWKKNSPYLYDLIITHALEWPSLTVQWLPEKKISADKDYKVQRMLLGTHTTDSEPNSLLIAEVQLPTEDTEIDARQFDDEKGQFGGYGGASSKFSISQQMYHNGEVNRARYNPLNEFLIATKSPNSEVYIFEISMHESKPAVKGVSTPQLVLKGHSEEGYGLAWSTINNGHLISGSDDGLICHWDVNSATKFMKSLDPLHTYKDTMKVVEDVCWHPRHGHMFGSCGHDQMVKIWDTRTGNLSQSTKVDATTVNTISFNPFNEFLLATGSSNNLVELWDMRKMIKPLYELNSHWGDIFKVEWNPNNETILASSGTDRRVMIWDLSRIGEEQTEEEKLDGPPELLFVHGGHTGKVSDMSWNMYDEWVMASVAEDNVLQVWQMTESIYAEGEEFVDDMSKESEQWKNLTA